MMIRSALEEIEIARKPLLERIAQLEAAIERALADAESGEGWGPDVTVCAYLKAALGGKNG